VVSEPVGDATAHASRSKRSAYENVRDSRDAGTSPLKLFQHTSMVLRKRGASDAVAKLQASQQSNNSHKRHHANTCARDTVRILTRDGSSCPSWMGCCQRAGCYSSTTTCHHTERQQRHTPSSTHETPTVTLTRGSSTSPVMMGCCQRAGCYSSTTTCHHTERQQRHTPSSTHETTVTLTGGSSTSPVMMGCRQRAGCYSSTASCHRQMNRLRYTHARGRACTVSNDRY
jgi:hypothetical protein